MIVYHGTNVDIPRNGILLSECRSATDFSKGFYVTVNKTQAEKRAKTSAKTIGAPLLMVYDLNESELNNLKVKTFKSIDREWATFVLNCRLKIIEQHGYDVVIGTMADSDLGYLITRIRYSKCTFEDGINELMERQFDYKSNQISFHTDRSLELLNKMEGVPVI